MNDDEEFIRDPDSIVNDQLLEDNRSDFDKQTDEAIYISMQEANASLQRNIEYEEQLLKDFEKTKMERTNEFKPLLTDLTRMSKFDKECKEIYDIIEPIIDAYCSQFIEFYDLDTITFE